MVSLGTVVNDAVLVVLINMEYVSPGHSHFGYCGLGERLLQKQTG